MSSSKQFILGLIFLLAIFSPAAAQDPPRNIGQCANTTIKSIETRIQEQVGTSFQNIPGSGSAIHFNNGEYQVSYDTVPAIEESQPEDEVRMCLVSIPSNCPKEDYRGREYRVTNLRTHESWTLPNSQHLCGGA